MDEKTFGERITDSISGPPKKRVTITFPEEVFSDLDKYSKEFSADCYWLAIKQLLDFFHEQKDGDIKSLMIMQAVSETKGRIEDLDERVCKLEHPQPENKQSFGRKKEKECEKECVI